MNPARQYAAALLAILAGAAAAVYTRGAQPQSQPANPPAAVAAPSQMNRNLVVLDPAHGGPDAGVVLGDNVLEKDIVLGVVAQLRAALTAAGFTVVATRDANSSDPQATLSTDQRAEIANHANAVACIVLHATKTGSGVHIYTSTLPPADIEENADGESGAAFVPIPWETAQTASVPQSLRLAEDLRSALAAGNLPVAVGKAPLRPLDNLMCPAIAVELAPLAVAGGDAAPVSDADYQKRVVAALAAALQTWRAHADPPAQSAQVQVDSKRRKMTQ